MQLTVSLGSYGVYSNSFSATHKLGVNTKSVISNTVQTSYQAAPPVDTGVPENLQIPPLTFESTYTSPR